MQKRFPTIKKDPIFHVEFDGNLIFSLSYAIKRYYKDSTGSVGTV